jgi:ABC-2 type transport system ATP-binding protein
MLSTQLKPTSGRLYVNGIDVQDQPKRVRRMIGIVPQTVAAYEKLTAWENLQLFAELHGVRGGEADRRAKDLLRMVGLTERRHDLVSTYSGGMKHRLNIVLGLVHDPSVVFFDEPTTGLDPIARAGLWDIIRLLQRAGKTIVLTTHYMDEAERLCDRVAILNRGRIVALGEPRKMGKSLEETFLQCVSGDDVAAGRPPA